MYRGNPRDPARHRDTWDRRRTKVADVACVAAMFVIALVLFGVALSTV